MKNKINQILLKSLFFVFIGLLSSCDFLSVDEYFDDTLKFDTVFTKKRYLESYLWGTAGQLPDESKIFGHEYAPGITAGDDIFTVMTSDIFKGMAFTLGQVTPDDLKGMDMWSSMYKIIRKVNLILARMDECEDMTTLDRRSFLGYAHFLRGYAYYHILMCYGPAILVGDKVYESNEEPEAYDTYRSTFDETVEYICSELETAAEYLPVKVSIAQFDRPTKGAAYSIIARVRLHAASQLFNGTDITRFYFGNWKRKTDNIPYINEVYSEYKWALAAGACKRVMDMGTYELFTVAKDANTPQLPENVPTANFPYGAGNIDPLKSYSYMFTGDEPFKNNIEVIWGRISGEVANYTQQSFPQYMGGYNGMGVTQKMIDAYRMSDGKTIQEATATGEYKEGPNDFTSGPRDFSDYHLNGSIWQMYENREMRFYACIGFSGCYWPALSTTEGGFKQQTVEYSIDGNAGKYAGTIGDTNYTPTGYVLKKYISSYDAWKGQNNERYEKGFPIIRYAEILLSYAEALNQLTTTHTVTFPSGEVYELSRNTEEMANAFNQVRYRAGLPGLTQEQLSSPTEMFEQIKRERMVEFLAEGRRFYDVRRWGIYEEVESEPIMGLNIAANKNGGFYQRTVVDNKEYRNRVVDRKLVFLPLSKSEIRKVPLLDQNPGWY
ncbi:MAG: RagB/SusD family nutrient uptake outer membrane protein [Bacteroides sp.]|nr:RagB/SusD family nutrient uptake outer membrane protein [Bacteroides sp.]